MFGRQARIPADLMYGTAEPESLNCTEYAAKLQESLSKAYTVANRKDKQRYTRKCMASHIRSGP